MNTLSKKGLISAELEHKICDRLNVDEERLLELYNHDYLTQNEIDGKLAWWYMDEIENFAYYESGEEVPNQFINEKL